MNNKLGRLLYCCIIYIIFSTGSFLLDYYVFDRAPLVINATNILGQLIFAGMFILLLYYVLGKVNTK